MSPQCLWLVVRVLTLIFLLVAGNVCKAQSVGQYNRIVSLVEDAAGSFVLLNTSVLRPVAAPTVHYLPGSAGETVMIADFPGLIWDKPVKLIFPSVPGLNCIRLAQFQSNPPIFRVAITTAQPRLLRQLALNSSPGSLIIKWPKRLSEPPATALALTPHLRLKSPHQPSLALQPAPGPRPAPALPNPRLPAATLPPAPRPAPPIRRVTRSDLSNSSSLTRSASTGGSPPSTGAAPTTAPPFSGLRKPPAHSPSLEEPSTPVPPASPTTLAPPAKSSAPLSAGPPAGKSGPQMSNAVSRDAGNAQPDRRASKSPVAGKPALSHTAAPVVAPPIEVESSAESKGSQPRLFDALTGGLLPGASDGPQLGLSGTNPLNLDLSATHRFGHNSFRLRNPERFVIDFTGLPELINVPVPVLPPNPLLRSIRVGNPENDPRRTRIVLDLGAANVLVEEAIREDNKLAWIISTGSSAVPGKLPKGTAIVIDAGHGGSDPGAQRGDIQEKSLTLSIAQKVKDKLQAAGARIIMTRADDTSVSLPDRVALTNSTVPNAFLSIHINSLEANSSIHGIETYYQTAQSKEFARYIHNALVSELSAPDRSVRKARFYVINHTEVPAVLAEVGFISNKEERRKLISSEYQEQVAEALARGMILYLSGKDDLLQSGNTIPSPGTTTDSAQSERLSSRGITSTGSD